MRRKNKYMGQWDWIGYDGIEGVVKRHQIHRGRIPTPYS
jgi:hypothetical protein